MTTSPKFSGIVLALAFAFLVLPCRSKSLEDLETGAAAVLMMKHSQLSPDRVERAFRFNAYMDGFFDGLILPNMMEKKKVGTPPASPPTPYGGDSA